MLCKTQRMRYRGCNWQRRGNRWHSPKHTTDRFFQHRYALAPTATAAGLRSQYILLASPSSACGAFLQVAALVALGHDEAIGAAVAAGLASEGGAHLRAALLSSASPLTTAWLAQVCQLLHLRCANLIM